MKNRKLGFYMKDCAFFRKAHYILTPCFPICGLKKHLKRYYSPPPLEKGDLSNKISPNPSFSKRWTE
jgi:hypothetical protein